MRVLLVTNGISSTLHATLELIERLESSGHTCLLTSHVDRSAEAAANDVEFVTLAADRVARDSIRTALTAVRRARWSMPRRLVDLVATVWRSRTSTRSLDELSELIRGFDPDVVVADIEAHVAIVGVLATGRPLVLTTFLFGIHQREGLPPVSSELLPGDSDIPAAWAGVHRANANASKRSLRGTVIDVVGPTMYGTTSPRALRSVARAQGVDLEAVTTSAWLRPFAYVGIPTLSYNLRELEFDHDVPADWHYVGPMVSSARQEAGLSNADDASWRRWADLADGSDLSCYASLGSYWDTDRRILEAIIAAFRGRPNRRLLLGLGGRLDPALLGDLPPNVVAMSWAPQVDALRTVDVAIVHGGNAALNECVVAGVPMIVVSTDHLDQPGIAARVAYHGIGVRLPRRATTTELLDAVDHTTFDPEVREQVDALAALAADDRRRRVAIDLIEQAAR